MAFDSLSEKLQNVFKNLRSKGRLTEADVKTALKEVKMALLEAEINFKVVKQFVGSLGHGCLGDEFIARISGHRVGPQRVDCYRIGCRFLV